MSLDRVTGDGGSLLAPHLRKPAADPVADLCCAPGKRVLDLPVSRVRSRIWELSTNLHCAIVGTCLSLADARRFAEKIAGHGVPRMSDLEVHETVVRAACEVNGGARELHKHLDRRHDLAIRRFDRAKSAEALLEAWNQARADGDIPGAFWAAMTHRIATPAFRARVFGEVHMLSHLVGAANRADIRRLTALEAENTELKLKVERQQGRMRDLVAVKEGVIARLEQRLAARLEAEARETQVPAGPDEAAVRELALSLQRRLDQKAARVTSLEEQMTRLRKALADAEAEGLRARQAGDALADELAALELRHAVRGERDDASAIAALLRGRHMLYCGGRQGHLESIRRLVESHGGSFMHHDGGIEERAGLLPAQVQRADLVMFPVDCISHDAMHVIKRLCRQGGKPYRALRTSSLGSFVFALREERPAQAAAEPGPVSRFCLRHG